MMSSHRHAYLIISYAQPLMLQRLIEALDDERNDIFVHIDKKASFDRASLHALRSSLHTYQAIDARWGDYSLVEVELLLIEAALKQGEYSYLHLLSDSDYPIKSQDYIHAECERLAGREFIGYARTDNAQKEIYNKVNYYYFFTKKFRENTFIHRAYKYLYVRAQMLLGVNRGRGIEFKRGSQWCSITGDFAQYVVSQKAAVQKQYHRTYCPDEIFMQTLCWNSHYKESIFSLSDEFEGCRRFINWHGRDIHEISDDCMDRMMSSDRWFARKFSESNMALLAEVCKRLEIQ